ncbi:MAG: gliding motility lipoprotein GldD [Flavobacteriales bacterium]|nr:gliding motility lipoprotein GldD [Flavobacteriales bacterium]|tara:strand:- start:550 stop:1095 length:546 start_codon:yes stop_codon:yes gene_type:complete
MRIRFVFVFLFLSCVENHTPKPRAFFKLEFPKKEYKKIDLNCPFIMEIPEYSTLIFKEKSDCLFDIDLIKLNAKIHITYLKLDDDLYLHTEQSRKLAYKHNVMADGISEQLYINDSLKVFGILYDYKGSTATAMQFFLTDSIQHFFRGALYFNKEINDSIMPLNIFLKDDVKHLIESFEWK